MNFLYSKCKRILLNKRDKRKTLISNEPFNNFYYKEVAKMTAAGGWSTNFKDKKVSLTLKNRES